MEGLLRTDWSRGREKSIESDIYSQKRNIPGKFLDTSAHLQSYKRVCPSVGPSVGPSRAFF